MTLFFFVFTYLYARYIITNEAMLYAPYIFSQIGKKGDAVLNIELQDNTGTVNIALWREHAELAMNKGDHMKLVNGSTSTFNHKVIVNSHRRSTITVCFNTYIYIYILLPGNTVSICIVSIC